MFGLKRFDRVKVISGFYQDYGGVVLDKRWFWWYGLNIGGEVKFVGRWHLKYLGKQRPDVHQRIREKMIRNDRK